MKIDTNKLRIRSATDSDTQVIFQFIQELAEFEKLTTEVVATEQSLKDSLFGSQKGSTEVLIAELDSEAVGFALFFQNFSTFLGKSGIYLEDLYVRPAFRSCGIGQKLLSHIAGLVIQRQFGRLEWSVLDWNENAIRFYKRLGAIPMKDWTQHRITGDALHKLAQSNSCKSNRS